MGLVNLGMLAGLAALGIPVLVHLVYGRRARPVQLGTLRFLKIVLQENVRRRRLKRWLLLALRMICVALVVLLFARPYLVAQDSGGEQRLVILLIDRSASMGLKSDGLRLLDVAIREANKIVADAGKGRDRGRLVDTPSTRFAVKPATLERRSRRIWPIN